MSLQFLLDSQELFQNRMGTDFKKLSIKESSAYLKEHGYFLMEEVMEMFREMPYHKSWKDYSKWDDETHADQLELMKDEAIDALHFMINILLVLGMNESEVVARYKEKNKLNYLRQENPHLGYVNK